MTCAKKQVKCVIVCNGNTKYTGTNACKNPQEECPRLPGENYLKCHEVCGQSGHAEIMAIKAAKRAGADLTNARAYIVGIDWICKDCHKALHAEGIHNIIIYAEIPVTYEDFKRYL